MPNVIRDGLEFADDEGAWPEDSLTLTRLLASRYSCRGYLPDQVPRPVIERMLCMAQLSASWSNMQPWDSIITEGEGTDRFRNALYEHAVADYEAHGGVPDIKPDFPFPASYPAFYQERRREVGFQLYDSLGIVKGDRVASGKAGLDNYRFFGAPHVIVITTDRDLGVYGAIDCGLYMGSILLAAESLGIGMIPQAALAVYTPFMREYFAIPEDRLIVVGASFGYADASHPANAFRSRRVDPRTSARWVTA
jgi:nitroreductase